MSDRTISPAEPCRPREDASHRSRRVVILLIALVLLSIGDLYATLTHVGALGMIELNPIAAYLIGAGSMIGLILYKLGTLGVAVAALAKIRAHAIGECAAWLLVGVMVMLTLHWYRYNVEAAATLQNTDYPALAHQIRMQYAAGQ